VPRLLKRETIQRLNISQQALRLAFSLLSTPKPLAYKRLSTDGALEIGLAGIAAELALAACLYELYGESGIVRPNGFYLTASEALARFRGTLSSSVSGISSITSGVADTAVHLQRIEEACSTFPVLFSARAAALHAGAGASHNVAFYAAKAAADFLLVLAGSRKWSPYLRDVPAIPHLPKDRQLIAQELAALTVSSNKHTAAGALSSIFLVLPELRESEPEWLEALQRVHVTPRKNDISILIKALQKAQVGDIFKVGKGKAAAPVTIGALGDPFAIPIYLQAMKKKFVNLNDQWSAYVAMANPALDKNILSLPPVQAVYWFASVGIENIGLPDEETKGGLSAHAVWPFIASALSYQGTKGPCFFVAQALKPSERGQLNALLDKACALSGRLASTLARYRPLLMATIEKKPVERTAKAVAELEEAIEQRKERRASLIEKLEERAEKAPWSDQEDYDSVCDMLQQSDSVAHVLDQILNGQINLGTSEVSILRRLIEAADDISSIAIMAEIVSDGRFSAIATPIRRAIRDIDYEHYGPEVNQ